LLLPKRLSGQSSEVNENDRLWPEESKYGDFGTFAQLHNERQKIKLTQAELWNKKRQA